MSLDTLETRLERIEELLRETWDPLLRRALEREADELRSLLRRREPAAPPPLDWKR